MNRQVSGCMLDLLTKLAPQPFFSCPGASKAPPMWWTAATGMLPAPVTESLFAPRRALTFVKYPDPE